MRKKIIAGNWKMYKTPDEARDFFRDSCRLSPITTATKSSSVPLILRSMLPSMTPAAPTLPIGAQNMNWQKEGAFTGEICASMLVAVGVTHVIIGHSERRQYFGETDDTVNLKLKAALEAGLVPIVCVGEVLEEREAGLTDDVLRRQCLRAFNKVSAKKAATHGGRLRARLGHWHRQNRDPAKLPPTPTPASEERSSNPSAANLPTTCASSTAAPSSPTMLTPSCPPRVSTAH